MTGAAAVAFAVILRALATQDIVRFDRYARRFGAGPSLSGSIEDLVAGQTISSTSRVGEARGSRATVPQLDPAVSRLVAELCAQLTALPGVDEQASRICAEIHARPPGRAATRSGQARTIKSFIIRGPR